jgi:phosphoglucomutase
MSESREVMKVSPLAGKPAPASLLIDVPKLITSYYTEEPDPSVSEQRVVFGTSGHRGSAFKATFNEWHVLAITQAICDYRKRHAIEGPVFVGIDTHALSVPALTSALEVFAANGVHTMISQDDETTPTPAVSLAILNYNRGRTTALADGVVITPSHNPPDNGGYKYNASNGGPAAIDVTRWIESRANTLLRASLDGVLRWPYRRALLADTMHRYDFLGAYVNDLSNVIDMKAIRSASLHMGVDPLGGAGVYYWGRIADRYQLDLTVVSDQVDPTFSFMSVDWDGQIRMDPSSSYAMQRLIALKDQYDVAFGCDTDHDRYGIVTRGAGLLPPNHYLAVMIDYLFTRRRQWGGRAAIGKTLVSSRIIDRVAKRLMRDLVEVPVGFKWFVEGLFNATLGFGGEESAGASFLRRDGTVWTTDKDGIIAALLSAEITAVTGRDPSDAYRLLTAELGEPVAQRLQAAATPAQKAKLSILSPHQITSTELAGEKIESIISHAPGNGAPIGGVRVSTENGWFAARPSGTEDIYKIYAESFLGRAHLQRILTQAQDIVGDAISAL